MAHDGQMIGGAVGDGTGGGIIDAPHTAQKRLVVGLAVWHAGQLTIGTTGAAGASCLTTARPGLRATLRIADRRWTTKKTTSATSSTKISQGPMPRSLTVRAEA